MNANEQMLQETVTRISGVNVRKCMRCGKCSGTCPAYGEMEYHPHQFVYMVEKGQIEKLMAIRQQGMNHLKPDDLPGKLDDEIPQQALMAAMRKYSK